MKQKSFTEAVLAFRQDAQQFKQVCMWRQTVVEFYSSFFEAEFRTSDTVRNIPEHHADEWRMFAIRDEIVFVLTYYYEDEIL